MNRREMLRAGLGLAIGAVVGGVTPIAHAGVDVGVSQSVSVAVKSRLLKTQWIMQVYNIGGLTPRQLMVFDAAFKNQA